MTDGQKILSAVLGVAVVIYIVKTVNLTNATKQGLVGDQEVSSVKPDKKRAFCQNHGGCYWLGICWPCTLKQSAV